MKNKDRRTEHFGIRMSKVFRARVKRMAKAEGVYESSLAEEAIERFLVVLEKKHGTSRAASGQDEN